MSNTIKDILDDANKDINSIIQHKNNSYLRLFMEAAFIPEKKINLPEGAPPYTQNNDSTYQNKGAMWQIARKLDVFYNPKMNQLRREAAFIGALENVSVEEANILLNMKDQTLSVVYPTLTYDALKQVGYF